MDVEQLLKSPREHKVRFVIIGATAFPVHGYLRKLRQRKRAAHRKT